MNKSNAEVRCLKNKQPIFNSHGETINENSIFINIKVPVLIFL